MNSKEDEYMSRDDMIREIKTLRYLVYMMRSQREKERDRCIKEIKDIDNQKRFLERMSPRRRLE